MKACFDDLVGVSGLSFHFLFGHLWWKFSLLYQLYEDSGNEIKLISMQCSGYHHHDDDDDEM